MAASTLLVLSGVSADGVPLVQALVLLPSAGPNVPFAQPTSVGSFAGEQWTGEHEEEEHVELRRQSTVVSSVPSLDESTGFDEATPIASSDQFEVKRRESLAAALAEADLAGSAGVPTVHHFVLEQKPILEVDESEEATTDDSGEAALARLLFTLRGLRMNAPDKYVEALGRLRQLDEELRAAGAVCPPDPHVAEAVAKALAAAGPDSDVQIRVNTSRHTTTTKTVYETETPALAALDPERVRELHQRMISDLSGGTNEASTDAGTTQKKETAEEGFTSEDGSVVVSKKMTRIVTTTRTTLPDESGDGGRSGEELIRLKVNEQVYSGSIDPQDHQIHLVPIQQEKPPQLD